MAPLPLLARGAVLLALLAIAACAAPSGRDARDTNGDAATTSGWVATGQFQ